MTESDLLRDQWRVVADSLAIQFIAPFFLPLPDGTQWEFAAHLPQVGGHRGMLIGSEYSATAFDQARLVGFAVSTMSAEHHHHPIDPISYVDCLVDWGWVGPSSAPEWYANAA